MTDGAYAAAVKLLQDRFEKPRIIHRLCCEDIKGLTPNNNSRVSITEMADKVQHILTGLRVLAHRKYRRPRSCPHLIDHIFGARIILILLFASLFY